MRSVALAGGLVLCLASAFVAPPVEAATIWTARIGSSYGDARITIGTSTRLGIAARNFRARITYTVSLRRGGCSTLGTLIVAKRMTTSSLGKITTSFALTTSQARLVKLPMAIRVGTKCGSFAFLSEPGAFADGTWRVGTTVEPGIYRTLGGPACHWARLSGFGGTRAEVIADNYSSGPFLAGPQIVRIADTDAGFTATGCGTWRRQSTPPVPVPNATPADGTWRVGIDVAPGTYRTPGTAATWPPYDWERFSKACRWARLSGFGGTDGEILGASSFSAGPQVVTIAATDAGFASNGCGTWYSQSTPPVAVPTAAPGDGTWRVGIDIQAGTYQAAGAGVSCRWSRISGFGGTPGEILASNAAPYAVPGPFVVTIAATDAGFTSLDCGIWTPTS